MIGIPTNKRKQTSKQTKGNISRKGVFCSVRCCDAKRLWAQTSHTKVYLMYVELLKIPQPRISLVVIATVVVITYF